MRRPPSHFGIPDPSPDFRVQPQGHRHRFDPSTQIVARFVLNDFTTSTASWPALLDVAEFLRTTKGHFGVGGRLGPGGKGPAIQYGEDGLKGSKK
jgi:hypothetical protein